MPRYDYRCDACGKTYELIQSFSAEPTHTCEKCGKGTARRLLSAPPIVFKGSGWYITDSRNGRSATSSSSSSSSDASNDGTPAKAEESAAS